MPGNDGNCHDDINTLQRRLAGRSIALFLDVDGTLLDIALRPDAVRVNSRLAELLQTLISRQDFSVALVSGRLLADLDRLFAPLRLPAAGLHGLERRDAAGVVHARDASAALGAARQWLAQHADPRILLEDKASALVLHYREHPEMEQQCRELAAGALRLLPAGWKVVPGRMSVEIRRGDIGKRDALVAFLAETPFRGQHPVFMGDDVTDEEGFEYMNAINGTSVHIGCSASAAQFRLADPQAVWLLLESLCGRSA